MMPTITVDDEVFAYLQSKATPFVDTPNAVLRRELPISAPISATPSDDFYSDLPLPLRLRRDAAGFGDDARYLRGKVATIYKDGTVWKRSGVRTPRGADLNQIQTWISDVIGKRDAGVARLIHNLRIGTERDSVANVTVVVEPQAASESGDSGPAS